MKLYAYKSCNFFFFYMKIIITHSKYAFGVMIIASIYIFPIHVGLCFKTCTPSCK